MSEKEKQRKKIELNIDDFKRLSFGSTQQIQFKTEYGAEEYGLPPEPTQRMWGAGMGVVAMWEDTIEIPTSIIEDACESAQDNEKLLELDGEYQLMLIELEAFKEIPEQMDYAYSPLPTGFPAIATATEESEIEYDFEWDAESQERLLEYERKIEEKRKELEAAVEHFCYSKMGKEEKREKKREEIREELERKRE